MASGVLIANGFLGIYPLIPVCNDSLKQITEIEVLPEMDLFKTIAGTYNTV